MQLINENRETPRERRRYIRLQQRREKSKGKFTLCTMSPITYLLAAMVWLWVVIEFIDELTR